MKTIKIIDLLNMISKGEEVPNKIKYQNYIYEYQHRRDTESSFNYMCNENGEYLSRRYFIDNILNDEVEIIEPQEHKIPEKICTNRIINTKDILEFEMIQNKINAEYTYVINEILDYLEEKE